MEVRKGIPFKHIGEFNGKHKKKRFKDITSMQRALSAL